MAQEPKRGCGFRHVGALYLVGDAFSAPCDRLPYELKSCPVCGAGIHFSRGCVEVIPSKLFGPHKDYTDKLHPCIMCDPTEDPAFIMTVGRKYYSPQSFLTEAQNLGISKRISSNSIPKHLILGETVIYLAHPDAVQVKVQKTEDKKGNGYLFPKDVYEGRLGIFMAFIPKRTEMPVWESHLKGKKGKAFKKSLEKRGITPVQIKDGDKDHK